MLHILELISLKIFDFHLLWTFLCPIFFLMWLMCLISYSSRRFHQRLFILNSSSSDNLYLFIPWDSLTAIIHSLFNCFLEFVSSLRSCQIELFEFCTRKKSSDFRLPSYSYLRYFTKLTCVARYALTLTTAKVKSNKIKKLKT